MSDLFKSALNYIGSSSTNSNSKNAPPNNSLQSQPVPGPPPSSEVIKLSGENVRIVKAIAEGGFSYVYGGQFTSTGEIIAVKKIPCQADMEDRILSEIKFMNGFSHVNIAKYFGYNKINNTYWIGLEYCSSLRTPVRDDCVGLIFGQIVSGVEYMHQQGITHWDLKIENCMLGRDQMIKLIDFGSANTAVYETSDLTSKERCQMEDELMRFTTPMYRPPEVLDLWSGIRIDYHVDLWALGCILYYLVHSEHPFSDSNKLAIINCKYSKKPSIFNKIIEGLLIVNPEGRWTPGGVLHELQSMGVDINAKVPIPFEEFQMPLPTMAAAANAVQSSSLLNSIKGGAESWFKNIKESSSRIYSAQSSQQPQPRPESGPPIKEARLPSRPPPPKPAPPKSPVARPPPPRQLTGEREFRQESQPATAFDLISDIDPAKPVSGDREPDIHFSSPETATDLLGGFRDDSVDLLSGTGPDLVSSERRSSGPHTRGSDLDDLFGFNQPTISKPVTVPDKVDLFDSLLTDHSFASEKSSVLPTSSSFSQLGAFKTESKTEMVKSTPNLNDMFGDLLSGSSFKPPAEANNPVSSGFPAFNVSNNSTNNPLPDNLFMNTNTVPVQPMKSYGNSTPSGNIPGISVGSNLPGGGLSSTSGGANYRPWTADMSSAFTQDKSDISGAGVAADPKNGGGKKLDLNAAFGELLNEQGFTGRGSQQATTKTINEMRRVELSQTKSPEQMRVADWVEGKRKNIRALLATLHTVTWEGCSWKPANMSTMVEPTDVKKVYRKACLAIHPDKQRGEECEELAKIIFVELNEAYNHFENENFK